MKKNIALIILFLSISFLTSCSKTNTSNAAINLDYWVFFGGWDGAYMKQMVEDYNKSQKEIHVRLLNIPWGDYYTKLRTSIVASSAPDVAICHSSRLAQLAPTGKLENLKTLGKNINFPWNDFSKNPLEASTYKGIQYAVPLDSHAFVMFYNVDILRECGILGPHEEYLKFPNGVDSFLEYLKIIKAKKPELFPFGTQSNGSIVSFWIWYIFYTQFKVAPEYINEQNAEFNNSAGLASLKLIKKLVNDGYWANGIGDAGDLFTMKKSVFLFEGVWMMGLMDRIKGLNYKVVPIPKLFDKQTAWGDSHTLIVPKQKDKKRMVAAMKFIDWLTQHSITWAGSGPIPARKAVVKSKAFSELPHRKDFAPVVSMIHRMPKVANMGGANDEIARDVAEMMRYKDITPEQTLKKMESDVNRVLDY